MNVPFQYVLRLGDNALILAQRLGEWCGHGPVLEQDIALANIALDQLGQARMLLTHAGALEGLGRGEDELAYFRDAHQYTNVLLVEHPNEDWAVTITRQFFFDAFNLPLYQALCLSSDEHLAAIAQKAVKEITYHLRFSSEWMIRLGDGTDLSRQKMQTAVDDLWKYTGELTTPDAVDQTAFETGLGPNLHDIRHAWDQTVTAVLFEATLTRPNETWMQTGGKQGRHTEKLGFMLAEMQHLQRTYPGQVW
ncbi:MAG: 1,2-phenylacetyl-CoA epoxidase subunit PaaC [Saprospiraceae bacterium]